MATDIATGAQVATNELPVQPLNASMSPGVAGVTPRDPNGTAQGGVRDLTGERLSQLAGYEAQIGAAAGAGVAAEDGRRRDYENQVMPLGGSYGDQPVLPGVPEDIVVPASGSFGYPMGNQPGA